MSGPGLYGCPICGQGLTPTELESHYTTELEYLGKICVSSDMVTRHRFNGHSQGGDQAPRNRWEVSNFHTLFV